MQFAKAICQQQFLSWSLTLGVLWAAHKFHPIEEGNSAGQQHGKASQSHVATLTGQGGRLVPQGKFPAFGLVVDVVKEAGLRYEKGIGLEWTL